MRRVPGAPRSSAPGTRRRRAGWFVLPPVAVICFEAAISLRTRSPVVQDGAAATGSRRRTQGDAEVRVSEGAGFVPLMPAAARTPRRLTDVAAAGSCRPVGSALGAGDGRVGPLREAGGRPKQYRARLRTRRSTSGRGARVSPSVPVPSAADPREAGGAIHEVFLPRLRTRPQASVCLTTLTASAPSDPSPGADAGGGRQSSRPAGRSGPAR